ncbi:hypothetical protein KQ302_04260 [Synechococcus sp. CS-602]|uniref:hypothetical protein n=2 Tax=Synechococcales TaxID=1890424 RepID=UPI0008FF16DA|nr:hypothetical protein [Synechococcus sp. SynAce01]MCT0202523.1 hypothetical protein [Synechococcus sp. CS-603]MCT0204327.1 hypothetical protein [Synechococcus sp. CS-602]MCT0247169.1 hypothetical protein [Synechococcus sp. CS-601]MCT4365457.1 hypothetical protein [Candidatus Regnicoccus frigidus MAG-AL1]TWB96463.1 hypothetical protein FB106_101128 [Synechococcus sp. Ace-Pa]
MVFNRKPAFFLNLDKNEPKDPLAVAPVAPKADAAKKASPAMAATAAKPAVASAPAAEPARAASPAVLTTAKVLTTAEVIAAELRLSQENSPPPSTVTFAPEQLIPSAALPRPRRLAGANLAGFKAIANSLTSG